MGISSSEVQFVVFLSLFLLLLVFLQIEGVFGDFIEPHNRLIGILHQEIFAIVGFEGQVDRRTYDPPSVGQVHIDLPRKVFRLQPLLAKDYMS